MGSVLHVELAHMRAKTIMIKEVVICALLTPMLFFLVSHHANGQDSRAINSEEKVVVDSLARAYQQQEAREDAQRQNSENLSDLKADKKETRAKAREAQRVENEANDAARQSRIAYRQEKNAQRARVQADKQAKKAAKAKRKSDNN